MNASLATQTFVCFCLNNAARMAGNEQTIHSQASLVEANRANWARINEHYGKSYHVVSIDEVPAERVAAAIQLIYANTDFSAYKRKDFKAAAAELGVVL